MKKMSIYWFYNGTKHEGIAEYQNEMIVFSGLERGNAFDVIEPDDCEEGITLDDIWSDLEAQADENGELDVTDIHLI